MGGKVKKELKDATLTIGKILLHSSASYKRKVGCSKHKAGSGGVRKKVK